MTVRSSSSKEHITLPQKLMGIGNGRADPWAVVNVWVWQISEAYHSHCKQNMLLSKPLVGGGGERAWAATAILAVDSV